MELDRCILGNNLKPKGISAQQLSHLIQASVVTTGGRFAGCVFVLIHRRQSIAA
jgi:hypothetical protein